MELSRLETDLLGDFAEGAHHVAEVFGFVRMQHGDLPDGELQAIGRDLLLSWISRGWLQVIAAAPPFERAVPDLSALQAIINEPYLQNGLWCGPNTWLWLTDKAWEDVPWLGSRPSHAPPA